MLISSYQCHVSLRLHKSSKISVWAEPVSPQWSITLPWLPRSQVRCMHSAVVPVDYYPVAMS